MKTITDSIDLISEVFQGYTSLIEGNTLLYAIMLLSIVGVAISVFWLVFNAFRK